jgi:hypothetical protein
MLLEMFIFKIHYWRYHQFLRQFCTVVLHFSYNLSILTITSLGHRIFAKSACLLVVELEANSLVSDFSIFPGTVFFRNTFLFLTIVSSLLQPSPSSESREEQAFIRKKVKIFLKLIVITVSIAPFFE